MKELLLEMKNIHKQFNGSVVLDDVNFSLYKGEVHALVGENGSGKSTLMNILTGVFESDSGEIIYNGQQVKISTPRQAESLGILAVYQDYRLFDNMSVAENIFIGHEPTYRIGKLKIINWRKINSVTKRILKYLNLKLDPSTYVSTLDYDERKLIEIAKIISVDSRLVIMDEPTTALNEIEIQLLYKVINDLKQAGTSIIFISHRINEVKSVADRVSILKNGKIATIENNTDISCQKIIKMIVGDDVSDRYPKIDIEPGKEVLLVKNLNVRGKISDVSFNLRKREILGVIGLRGSGNNTLAKVLFGSEMSYTGNIYLKGRKIQLRNTEDSVKNRIGYANSNNFEYGLIEKMSVSNNIVSANVDEIPGFLHISTRAKEEIAQKYIRMLGMKVQNPSEKIRYLSGGTQKKVILAKWLFNNSNIFILNNPTGGIDVSSKVDIYNIMSELVYDGTSIIFLSQDIGELLGMCDRILVMYRGRIVRELDRGEATKEKILYFATGGEYTG